MTDIDFRDPRARQIRRLHNKHAEEVKELFVKVAAARNTGHFTITDAGQTVSFSIHGETLTMPNPFYFNPTEA